MRNTLQNVTYARGSIHYDFYLFHSGHKKISTDNSFNYDIKVFMHDIIEVLQNLRYTMACIL